MDNLFETHANFLIRDNMNNLFETYAKLPFYVTMYLVSIAVRICTYTTARKIRKQNTVDLSLPLTWTSGC